MRRRPSAPRMRVSDLSNDQLFDLTLACSMPVSWADSWVVYLDIYNQVRQELLEHSIEPFGESVWRFREAHGAAALDAATYEVIVACGREVASAT